MKIRRLQIAMEPYLHSDGNRYITVEVRTDCGNIFSVMNIINDNHFQDVFGYLMKDAEHQIRQLVKEKTAPADSKL